MTAVQAVFRTSSAVVGATFLYYRGLVHYLISRRRYTDCTLFPDQPARQLHIYSLALTFQLWDSPHYRASSFAKDVKNNLANVAIPGTGVPLSFFCSSKLLLALFIFLIYPLGALTAMIYIHFTLGSDMVQTYEELLLEPRHWFAIWRLNSLLVAQHEHATHAPGYSMEDKGLFLTEGDGKGVAVSPVLRLPAIVAKHAKVEGGMAIHFFRNFLEGGDWILQPAMQNSPFVASLLPPNAPLSTLRVITASKQGMKLAKSQGPSAAGGVSAAQDGDGANRDGSSPCDEAVEDWEGGVEVATVVFRAGRAGAATDHVSVCFDVDRTSGVIGQGTSNQHWYQLGMRAVGCIGDSLSVVYDCHPDTNRQVAGKQIPEFDQILKLVKDAHVKMVPDVPLVGWDVALTDEGMYLLELNISCNFFNGSYDRNWYLDFMARYFTAMNELERTTALGSRKQH